jgi:hypothetical protein
MLNPCSILLTEQKSVSLLNSEELSDPPRPLWSQMDPASRQQLSQMIAKLIRRMRLPLTEKEVGDDAAA